MKNFTALLALMATFAFTVPFSVQASTQATITVSDSDNGGLTNSILRWAAEEFNLSCGTDYCFSQLKRFHRRGDLVIEEVGEDTYRVSLGGNDLIGTLEDFL